MRYLGGKSKVSKEICEFINAYMREYQISAYIEPFVGAGWVLSGISPEFIRVASDTHTDLIMMWQALSQGWEPPEFVSKEEYNQFKADTVPSALRGFVGFGCSYSGKWFGGYAKDGNGRNYAKNARNSLQKKQSRIKGVEFQCKSYSETVADHCCIYCDPPYQGTTGYSGTPKFDHEEFWEWVRRMSETNVVFVSEYSAPKDFIAVLEITTKTNMCGGNMSRIEKLFQFGGI